MAARVGLSALMGSMRLQSSCIHELPFSYITRSLANGPSGGSAGGGSSGSGLGNGPSAASDKGSNDSDKQWQALSDVLRGKSKLAVGGSGFSDPFPGLGLGSGGATDAAPAQDWRQLMSLGRPAAATAVDASTSDSGRPDAWKKLMEDLKQGSQTKEEPSGPPKWDLLRKVAIFTERIAYLSAHAKKHAKDHLAKRQLTAMLTQRRKLLKYLRKHDGERYGSLINAVGLKDSGAYKA
eukprot:jgi/Mesvir1/10076/Mv21652-RA.1